MIYVTIMSIGNGMFQSPNTSLIMSTVPRDKLGIAGSINGLVRNLGMISGIALSVSLFEAWGGVSRPRPDQIPVFMSAYHSVMLVATGIALLAAVVSLNRKSYAHSPNLNPETKIPDPNKESN
jgi:predicted MFS family arabinose efflux permease